MNFITADNYCQHITDGTHDSPKYTKDGFHLVTSRFVKDGKVLLDLCPYISKKDYDLINQRSKTSINDVLFTMIGTIGEVALVREDDYAIKNVGLFHCKNEVDSKFLLYYFNSQIGQDNIFSLKTGSTQHYLTLDSLRKFPIPDCGENIKQHIVDTI